jgi:hypothetical protein
MRWFAEGAAIGMVGSPFLAAVTALVFRFPVPFYKYVSGPPGVVLAFEGAIFYGLLGGFLVEAVLGGLGGALGARRGWPVKKRMHRLCAIGALASAELGVMVLAVLDWVIGPW